MSSSDEDEISEPELETLDISNDKYYQPVTGQKAKQLEPVEDLSIPKYGSSTIQHSLPAYDLWRPFFPTYLSAEKYQNFHRPKLRHYNIGPQALTKFSRPRAFPVKNLARSLYRYQKRLRNKVIQSINNGMTRDAIIKNILLIRDAHDLTAKRGELFLFEYIEEYPPVLNQLGMASNVKTIINPGPGVNNVLRVNKPVLTNVNAPNHKAAGKQTETEHVQTTVNIINDKIETSNVNQAQTKASGNYKIGIDEIMSKNSRAKPVYYSQLKPGTKLKVIENNMYRAPIFEHEVPSCDFIIIRTRNGFYIRTVRTIFTVGQTMPLVPIPEPSERSIQRFRLELSNCYIHKLFMDSITDPPTMSLNTLHKYFPDYDRRILRRRVLTNGVETDFGDSYFKGTSNYGAIPLKELRRRFTPEQYCLNMAMLVARDRLRDLNYSESMINPSNAEADLETEVLAAPWNTSKAVVSAMSGRCFLDLKKHLIDPTGPQREGFSCISWVKSPTEEQQQKSQQKDPATCNDPPSTQPLLLDKNPLLYKIKQEKLERLAIYQRESNMISNIQADVLASKEILSSDEDEEEIVGADDDDPLETSFDEELRDLDRLVNGGRTTEELEYEKEEEVRQAMVRDLAHNNTLSNGLTKQISPVKANQAQINVADYKHKVLKITRLICSPEGDIEPRVEVVREPKIIALYIKRKLASAQTSDSSTQIKTNGLNSISQKFIHSMTNGVHRSPTKRRRSLGPMELCRAEGTVLTISKSVLNPRDLRHSRRRVRLSVNVA